MTIAAPDTLDIDIDLALDDVADLPALLHEVRARRPAAWVRAFGRPTLLLSCHELVDRIEARGGADLVAEFTRV